MSKRAFTLIELLVVVAIIALLIAILLPSLAKARDQGSRAVCLARLHQNGIGFSVYAREHKNFLPMRGAYAYTIKEPEDWALERNLIKQNNQRIRVNYGILYGKYCGGEGQFFYCPSNIKYNYTAIPNGWISFKATYPSDPDYTAITWGGYTYGATVEMASYPIEGEVARIKTANNNLRIYWSKYKEDPRGNFDDSTLGYIPRAPMTARVTPENWALSQYVNPPNNNPANRPYHSRWYALMSDILTADYPAHKTGYNVMYSDYHAKFVQDLDGYLKSLYKTSGATGTNGQYACYSFFAKHQ